MSRKGGKSKRKITPSSMLGPSLMLSAVFFFPSAAGDLLKPTASPASSADMAPISSGSSTWTSSGLPFSFVSMATGMGPSSSGSQATVASVVTSTLLAGLGFSGGGISSFPSSVWPTRLPTAAASSKQAGRPVVTATEAAAASPGPERDSALTKDGEGAEEGEKDEKSESEDGEREHEEEEEKDAEKKEKTRVTAAAEAHSSTEPSVAAASPNRTAEEEGNKTISGEEPNQNVAPTAGGPEEESFAEGDAQPQPFPSTQVPPAFTNELYLGKVPRRPETTRKPPRKEDRFPEEYPSDNKFITINPGE